jgi:electron transport complex protein RnfC
MRLIPCEVVKLVNHRNFKEAERYNILDCIECGCCGYTCPARIPLVHTIRFGKAEILAQR